MAAVYPTLEEELDIVGAEAVRDPHGYFGRLRDRAPILWDTRSRSWIVTGYKQVSAVLRNDRLFSSDRIRPFIAKKLSGPATDPLVRRGFDVLANWLVFNDKPIHLRLRLLVNQAFMGEAMASLSERVGELCDEILAATPDSGGVEFLEQFAVPFSASVISEILGVPKEDRGRFEQWHRLFGPIIGASLEDATKYDSLAKGVEELTAYVRSMIERYRHAPEDNLLSGLIKARDSKDALSEEEIIATCTLILFAGSETTANLMANSLLALLRHPEQMRALRAGESSITAAVEEFLRFDGSGKAVTRLVRQDNTALGVDMRAGQRLFLILAAANHDPAAFSEPDRLLLNREAGQKHIAFGYGIHTCMGSFLARLETSLAIPRILAKWRHIELAGELQWHAQLLSRGLKALPLRVRAG